MMEQYKEQYKKETEQIHAPVDLIARTKAAVREEEARIQRERAAQTAERQIQVTPVVQRTVNPGAAARKWAYPLTIVAAIFILLSVSLMMRGLGKSGSDTASYELASEADSGGEESASGAAFEDEAPEAAFVTEAASPAEAEASDSEAAATSGTADLADETKRAAAIDEAASESETIEDAMSQKQEGLTDSAAQAESVTITKVWKKPAFVDRAKTESRTYEDMVFYVAEDGEGWIAYVESESGGGYVIRGETETIEAFLEAGYKRLLEISF